MSNHYRKKFAVLLGTAILLPLAGAIASLLQQREVLLGLYLAVVLFVFLAVLTRNRFGISQDLLFIMIIASISSFLILSTTMTSSAIQGWDINQEYALYQEVSKDGVWHPSVDVQYNSVLSVTVLPTILNAVTGIEGIQIFKIVIPMLFSLVPVILYFAYRKILPPVAAFASVLLFVSYPTFNIELIALARQEIAELLLALALWTIMSSKIQGTSKVGVVLLLSLGIITAHYSLAYIYIFVLLFSFALSMVFGRPTRLVSFGVMTVAWLMAVAWYALLTSGTDFLNLISFILYVSQNLTDFLNPFTRPPVVLGAFGIGALSGPLHLLNRVFYYLVHIVLAGGYVAFAFKRGKSVEESKLFTLITSGMILLGSVVVLPNFAVALNFSRTYHIALLLASPCFGYGAASLPEMVTNALRRIFSQKLPQMRVHVPYRWVLAICILLSFLLFSSGWVWAVSLDRPTSFALDSQRLLTYPDPALRTGYFGYFTSAEDIAGAQWLRAHDLNGPALCADYISMNNVMASYGGVPRTNSYGDFSPSTCNFRSSIVFLSVLNTRYYNWTISYSANDTLPMTMINPELGTLNRIYTSGGTTIYA